MIIDKTQTGDGPGLMSPVVRAIMGTRTANIVACPATLELPNAHKILGIGIVVLDENGAMKPHPLFCLDLFNAQALAVSLQIAIRSLTPEISNQPKPFGADAPPDFVRGYVSAWLETIHPGVVPADHRFQLEVAYDTTSKAEACWWFAVTLIDPGGLSRGEIGDGFVFSDGSVEGLHVWPAD